MDRAAPGPEFALDDRPAGKQSVPWACSLSAEVLQAPSPDQVLFPGVHQELARGRQATLRVWSAKNLPFT